MTIKDYISIIGVPLLCLGITLGISHFYRSEDKNGVDAQELQAHKNKFQEHLLDNQKELFEIRQELSLISQHVIQANRQYQYIDSRYKLADEAMKAEIIKEVKK